jgi:hypothetical protein
MEVIMALKPCPECGHMVSTQTAICPNCGGFPNRKLWHTLLPVTIGIMLLLAVILFFAFIVSNSG